MEQFIELAPAQSEAIPTTSEKIFITALRETPYISRRNVYDQFASHHRKQGTRFKVMVLGERRNLVKPMCLRGVWDQKGQPVEPDAFGSPKEGSMIPKTGWSWQIGLSRATIPSRQGCCTICGSGYFAGCAHSRRLRASGGASNTSRSAGLVGRRVDGKWLEYQAHPSRDGHQRNPSPEKPSHGTMLEMDPSNRGGLTPPDVACPAG